MPTFSYTGSGGIEAFGCAGPNNATYTIYTAFAAGDLVWIKQQARKGILEKVVIKKINFISMVLYNYQDSFNRLWLEKELCDLATAQALIATYEARAQAALILALKNCQATIT